MEILGELVSGANDHVIVRRKRTKRSRMTYSSSSSGGVDPGSMLVSSPASSTSMEEEDADMANCLILLASGGRFPRKGMAEEKLIENRKFTETTTAAGGKVVIYGYECKTCNKTFPSFQALGGHRASHRKLKPALDDDRKKPHIAPLSPAEEDDKGGLTTAFEARSSPPSMQIRCRSVEIKPKIHECSLCGSEFATGQALGGHMRRHRAAAAAAPISTAKTPKIINDDSSSLDVDENPSARKIMSLDLNLPALPEDDFPPEAKFSRFSTSRPPSHLVFSAAPLVDCNY